MAFDADEEILQDFLVEAGEILEQLSEQLVELEQQPQDIDLLNAIFRSFHTIKGGAGFLQLEALVECCHIAENVFDVLRNGKRSADANLMDVVLRALDTVNDMFDQVRAREEPTPAERSLLDDLQKYATPDDGTPVAEAPAETPVEEPVAAEAPTTEAEPEGDITDDEFEQLLNALDSPEENKAAEEAPASAAASDSDEITDEEFENLLDELHGKGQPVSDEAPAEPAKEAPAAGGDEITDDEFERLLDELHGAGPVGAVEEKGTSDEKAADTSAEAKTESASTAETPAAEPKAEIQAAPPEPAPAPVAKAAPKPAPRAGGAKTDAIVAESTVRVDTKRLDEIMNMVGELVLVRNRLKRLGDDMRHEPLQKAVSNLDVVTGDLQTAVMKTRMQPIKKVFGRFPRVVRDLARSLKKEINLVLEGEETDLDKNLVEALSDPLVHLVRNAVDHGVEMPDIRESVGKPRVGKIVLSARQEGDHILLSITDDGAGMDPEVLRGKAIEKGIYDADAAARLTDVECYNLIFAPGFSTKQEISDISGRGVGMDVVKTKINQLNGTVNIDSELGKGSTLVIKVPLTLAIMPTLMVKLDQQPFALPLVSVVEIFDLDLSKTNTVDGQECIVVRENVYPLFYIKRWLVGHTAGGSDSAHVVIVAVGTKRVGFVVDQLIGQEEVVIKPLGAMLLGTPGMAGATITGDGRIALILDIPSLLSRYG